MSYIRLWIVHLCSIFEWDVSASQEVAHNWIFFNLKSIILNTFWPINNAIMLHCAGHLLEILCQQSLSLLWSLHSVSHLPVWHNSCCLDPDTFELPQGVPEITDVVESTSAIDLGWISRPQVIFVANWEVQIILDWVANGWGQGFRL